jgi:hypothetical protein
MVVTEIGRSGDALNLTVSGTRPTYMSVGVGSKTETRYVTNMGSEWVRLPFTTTDISTAQQVTWTADFSSVIMSGATFREFALQTGSPGQEPWHYVNLGDSITFDGSNELRIELTWVKY